MATRNVIELLIQAKDEASRQLSDIANRITSLENAGGPAGRSLDMVTESSRGLSGGLLEMTAGMALGQLAFSAMQKAADLTFGTFAKGIKNIDDLKMAQASMASAAFTNEPKRGWDDVYDTTGRIVEKVYELDRAFIGTGDELLMLSDSMVTFGMGIDLSTKKQQDEFVAFGNLLKMMTKGQDFQRQAYQEIRALMEGVDVQGAMLIKKLEAAGVNVKQMVPEWREQGVLLEKIMETLPGYLRGSQEVEKTLQAQKSSLETITFKILREGLGPAYEDIAEFVKGINDSLVDQNGLTDRGRALVELLQLGWDAVTTSVRGATAAIQKILEPIGWVVDKWKELSKAGNMNVVPVEGVWAEPGTTPWEEAFSPTPWKVAKRPTIDELSAQNVERRNWSESMAAEIGAGVGGNLKLAPGSGKQDEAAAREREQAASKLQKKIEDIYDKIAIEAARKRGGDIEAELEKARIDYVKQKREITELQVTANIGKVKRTDQISNLDTVYEEEREKIILKYEDRIRTEVDKIRKKVEVEEEKERTRRLQKIGKDAEEELNIIIRQDEKKAELMAQYEEQSRYYSERAPRVWEVPGGKERQKAEHDFQVEKNNLETLRRKGQEGLAGGIRADQYDDLMAKLVEVHKERLGQIEDQTDESTKRQEILWEDMFGGMQETFGTVFYDAFSGKLKTMADYFEGALDIMRRAWANYLSDMLTKWIETQIQMAASESGGGGLGSFLSKLIGAASSSGSGGGWGATEANQSLAMDSSHAGMYGLAEGGIITRGIRKIARYAEGGIVPGGLSHVAFAGNAGILGPVAIPFRAFSDGGVANQPVLAAIGGGALDPGGGPEAVIPLKGGKVPVDIRGGRGMEVLNNTVNVNFAINAIDSKSVKQMLLEERGMLSGIIRNEIETASAMRDAMRR